ncbi:hypothetical protein CDAR_123251 [Caerostris darwini]|uniref:Uncharacterized protein n=1 Tax=Caerostris darwini TaxID=1538125 RepID=A0AAV4QF83_9ARAC|nr:hypothetical protein CDAR_123251 [Caerostris darwini]
MDFALPRSASVQQWTYQVADEDIQTIRIKVNRSGTGSVHAWLDMKYRRLFCERSLTGREGRRRERSRGKRHFSSR